MKRTIAILTALILATTSITASAKTANDVSLIRKIQRNLQLASVWLIEEGVLTYIRSGKEGIHRKLVDEWGVQIWVDPWIESDRFIDGFWIKARGINHDVINFHRETLPSGIYEFWVVKVDGKDWSGVGSSAKFYVAKTDGIYSRRTIIEQGDLFIQEYRVDENTTISFPIDYPDVLYELQAWRYPQNFCNSDIRNIRAEIQRDGSIELTRREIPCAD